MEFILTFLIVIFVFGWLVRRLFPLLLTWYVKRKMQNGGASFGGFGTGADYESEVRRSKEQEGRVTVTQVEQREKVIERDMGEYVDFEE